jgi:hypothetical protein
MEIVMTTTRKENLMVEIVETKNELVVFDEVAAIIADYKVENEELSFDYESKEGVKQVKGHIANLRKVKTKVSEIHKEAKAESRAFGLRLDAKKNEYNGEVDKMIDFHKKPLEAIEEKETEEALARQQEAVDAKAREIAAMEARERAIILAEEKIAREKAEAEEKARREAAEAAEKVIKEQQEKIKRAEEENRRILEEAAKARAKLQEEADKARIEAEQKAKAEAEAEEERLADIAAEKAIEASRIKDKKHRSNVEDKIQKYFTDNGFNPDMAYSILVLLKNGKIPHVSINY